MDNVITFQMRSAEQEEDLGELWERMQANLTAVSSSRASAGGHTPAPSQPGPPYIPWLGMDSAGSTSGLEGTRENIWSPQRPRVLRASHSLPLSPQGTAMSPAWQVGAGFPIWLLWAGTGPVPGDGAAPVAGKVCCSIPPACGPSSHTRWEAWAQPSSGSSSRSRAKEQAFSTVQQIGDDLLQP